MLIGDALRFPGSRARIESLAHIAGLNEFDLVAVSREEQDAIAAVLRDYVALLQRIEDRLDREASERAEPWLRRLNIPRLPNVQLDPALCTEFRVYGDWILKELRTFGQALEQGTDAPSESSSVGKLIRGLAVHCKECVAETEACIAEIRAGNAGELNRDDMLDEGDEVRRGLATWRLPATALIMVLIELGDLKIADTDEEIIWGGLSGGDGNCILADVVVVKAGDT